MPLLQLLRKHTPAPIRASFRAYRGLKPRCKRHCPLCGYHGFFTHAGRPPRLDAMCPKCASRERHRLFWLWFEGDASKLCEPILHFAPEKELSQRFRTIYQNYRTADLHAPADCALDIENIDLEDGSVNTVICNHVLEHVDDAKALAQLHRILAADGVLIVSVPIVQGWEATYENPRITAPAEREAHFGQYDHVRLYGCDFVARLRAAGFATIQPHSANGEDTVRYGLIPGEQFFVCRK